ncbi:MAG TPA: rRNA pseudouridine synthase [Candidatus Caccalectryoclostridium excrementigallinarum]|uniref:Pseudouridine synthase n=1 Tax=Candidatus Caccalectryoclostridium excrementigallinarum TaxID=2840710 RepID=A0A9D1ML98_9FIRM|nr:rRNA pseudouridine synthase [Candidatus Caccalectryoclostridium excrementigallinarum]
MKVRLNKFLASCGAASRRGADELIASGRVRVNSIVVTELGKMVETDNDTVTLDGKKVEPVSKMTYIMLYKPKGCITSLRDEKGRKTVYDYLDVEVPHLVPVGRLDYDTEGLLLLTNDGELVNRLAHPSGEVPKSYLVRAEGEFPEHILAKLRKGVEIDGVKTKRSKVKLLEQGEKEAKLLVTITEGRNRQVRRMFEAVERNVVFLKRVAIGDLRLGGLARGAWRYLREEEVEYLKRF